MRYLLLLFMSFCIYLPTQAQVFANGEDINKLEDVKYIEVSPVVNLSTALKIKCLVNYGQSIRLNGYNKHYLRNSKNKKRDYVIFDSRVGILNWFDKQGWELFQVIPESTGGTNSNNDVIYVLKRK